MKSKVQLFCGLAVLLTLGAGRSSAADDAGKWVSLFNGKDLTGWVPVHDVTFAVTNGDLRLVKGMGWLRTQKEYKDFVLEFETRPLEERFDSGIFIRAGLEGKPWPDEGY